MQLSSPTAQPEPLRTEHRRGRPSNDACDPPLRCLSSDEVEFIGAAFNRILPGEGLSADGACTLDRKLWEASLPRGEQTHDIVSRTPERAQRSAAFYKAGIAIVQTHCIRIYGRRFQFLPAPRQLDVLAQLEEGVGFGEDGQVRVLAFMLLRDAAEAYFDLVADESA